MRKSHWSDGRFKMEDGVQVEEDRNPFVQVRIGDLFGTHPSTTSDWLMHGSCDAKVDDEKGLEGEMNDLNL